MATQYNLTGSFVTITEESGTIQNIGYEAAELVSTTNATEGQGIELLPGEKRTFNGAMKARSKGGANTTVNVVDFKDAAEGGDVMTGASSSEDGTSGLVPQPTAGNENKFLRADGTWAVPTDADTQYQPATELSDGLMSAADKKNLDDIESNYRKADTDYFVNNIAYHIKLPTGWYLECTTPGITSASDLVITSPAIGDTVTDGTVVWKIRAVASTADIPAPVDISGKANVDLDNLSPAGEAKIQSVSPRYLVDSYYGNDGSWWRRYSDGWLEQSGIVNATSVWTTVNLLKPFADSNYTVLAACVDNSYGIGFRNRTTTTFQIYQNVKQLWYACGMGAQS